MVRCQFRVKDQRFHCGQVNVLLALNDIGPGDGATMLVPASHKSNFRHPDLDRARRKGSVEVDLQLVHNNSCDALAFICHRNDAEHRGRAIIKSLKEEIPKHLFEVALQAAIGGKVVARETIKSVGKNVTAKCYGGDVSRKRKLLEKQKEGNKRMKMVGSVEVPQAAFMAVLKSRSGDSA